MTIIMTIIMTIVMTIIIIIVITIISSIISSILSLLSILTSAGDMFLVVALKVIELIEKMMFLIFDSFTLILDLNNFMILIIQFEYLIF